MEGTGTQYHQFAGSGESMTINGTRWKVGRDYLDTEMKDLCHLVEIVGISRWRHMDDASERPPILIFEYERGPTRLEVDPHSPEGLDDRFIERREPEPAPKYPR